tara:strand:+ start:1068 stop:1439 length:372 start_codon:yes stop_codon:yes gene_type:complete
MAVNLGHIPGSYIGATLIEDTAANATKQIGKASSGTIYQVFIDNTSNSSAVYLKVYDLASGSVTVGQTHPDFVFPCPGSGKRQFNFPDGIAFATAFTYAITTSPGTAGSSDPSPTPTVRITIS